MPLIDVWLKFGSDDDRKRFLHHQRTLPDGDLIDDEQSLRYRLESASELAALARADILRDGHCQEAGIDREQMRLSLTPPDGGEDSPPATSPG